MDVNAKGTETDRLWKIVYTQNTEITVHFYDHNKPKDKKNSVNRTE